MRRILFLLSAGCGVSFPAEEQVEDLRILEIRTSPPEIPVFSEVKIDATVDDLAVLPRNDEPVRLSALVAHPDLDASIEVEWIRCTSRQGSGFFRIPCEGGVKQRLGVGTSTDVEPIRLALEDVTLEGGIAETFAAFVDDPRDLFNGFRAFFNAQATVTSAAIETDTTRLEGTKRLLIFDPTIVSLVLREARGRGVGAIPMIEGFQLPTLCTNVSEERFGTILGYLEQRQPNRAPTYASIEYTPLAQASTVAYAGETIMVSPNDSITFRGRAADGDKETYRSIDDKCSLLEFSETMSWSWFTNVGDISDQITSEGQTIVRGDVETTWRAPPVGELESGDTRVRIWSVLRDGRGGSAHRVIDLVISNSG